jgi:hypothetical protein
MLRCLVQTTQLDGCLDKMAPQRIRRHNCDTQEHLQLHLNNANRKLQSRCHLWPKCQSQQVKIPQLKPPKLPVCRLDMLINIHIFPALNLILLMHEPWIGSTIQFCIQICWQMKEHALYLYTICCRVMQETCILKTRAAYWANLQVITSIDWEAPDFWDYYYLQLADTVKYILEDIFICSIKEQCSDREESTQKG